MKDESSDFDIDTILAKYSLLFLLDGDQLKQLYIPRLLLVYLIVLCLFLTACREISSDSSPSESISSPAPTQVSTPTPTPFLEPVMEESTISAYFDGVLLESGVFQKDSINYVKLSEIAAALDLTVTRDAQCFIFTVTWRKDQIELSPNSDTVLYLGKVRKLDAKPILFHDGNDLYIPVKSFCSAAEIGFYEYYDEEAAATSYFCTPGAGDWDIPENYNVPVLMYHGVGHSPPDANLIITPERLEEEIVYMLDHGFTPIWFEDLWHVEDFTKPVIMVFDDGWVGAYTYLFPLAEKYQVKVSVAIVKNISNVHRDYGKHITIEMIEEMMSSPYIRFESHGVTHDALDSLKEEKVDGELKESEEWITQLVKKEPCTFVYPIGGSSPFIQESLLKYYKFGVKMVHPDVRAGIKNSSYNTSDDPSLVYRFFVQRNTPVERLATWLEDPFKDPTANNYVSPEANELIIKSIQDNAERVADSESASNDCSASEAPDSDSVAYPHGDTEDNIGTEEPDQTELSPTVSAQTDTDSSFSSSDPLSFDTLWTTDGATSEIGGKATVYSDYDHGIYYQTSDCFFYLPKECDESTKYLVYFAGGTGGWVLRQDIVQTYLETYQPNAICIFLKCSEIYNYDNAFPRILNLLREFCLHTQVQPKHVTIAGESVGGYSTLYLSAFLYNQCRIVSDSILIFDMGLNWARPGALISKEDAQPMIEMDTIVYCFGRDGEIFEFPGAQQFAEYGIRMIEVACKGEGHDTIWKDAFRKGTFSWALGEQELDHDWYTLKNINF